MRKAFSFVLVPKIEYGYAFLLSHSYGLCRAASLSFQVKITETNIRIFYKAGVPQFQNNKRKLIPTICSAKVEICHSRQKHLLFRKDMVK